MNKRRNDILAYFDHYILWCLIHAAYIRHTINAL
nr:transposase [Corynebacterium diphtheriae]